MYRDFYGFTRCPFQLTPDPACHFESISQRQAATCLNHGLARGEGFVVLTGAIGVGKTTLVTQMMATIDPDQVIVAQMAGDRLVPVRRHPADGPLNSPMVAAIADAFRLTADPIPGLPAETHNPFTLDTILTFLRAEVWADRRCLLVVDEAQALPIVALDVLRLMADFRLGDRPLLQILLVGQPELRARLQGHPDLEQLRQRVVAAHHLDPLASDEVERYIHHRLAYAGWTGNPGFAPQIAADIYTATSGLPRRIDQIVDRLLLLGAAQQQAHIDGAMLSQVLVEWIDHASAEDERHPSAGAGLKSRLEEALARSEGQIAELRQAVAQLADSFARDNQAAQHRQQDAALEERFSSLESRLIEQEGTIRHTLTMLIDWIERDEAHSVAA